MFFDSWPFLYLLITCLVMYHVVLRGHRLAQHTLLLVASYVFYGWWDWRFLSLIAFSTAVDYLVSLRIDGLRRQGADPGAAKWWVTLSIVINLALLGFFKYFNFFAENVGRVTGLFGFEPSWITLNVVLPVGISFYTFQSMAYTIDVYRGHTPVCRNPITFALYVSFFPQLVAGPIERSQHLVPQFDNPKPMDMNRVQSGLVLLLLGFFKKIAIADPIAPYVTEVLQNPAAFDGQRLTMCMYLFSFQLYADFSGYSDIARGSARLFGIDLVRNFESPYFSTTVGEFWRRWHISLMAWFRDYLFIPLGGSRMPNRRVYLNLMLVMSLAGLWHGAGWSWPLWGAMNGFYVCCERYAAQRRELLGIRPAPLTRWSHILRALWVYHLFCLGTVVFLNRTFAAFLDYLYGMAFGWAPWDATDVRLGLWLGVYMAAVLFIDVMQRCTGYHEFPLLMRPIAGGMVVGFMLVCVIYWSVQKSVPYFYFQF